MKNVDTTKLTSLERNVYGKNLINELTLKNLKKVLPQLEEFTGQKIRLASGDKSAKFKIDTYKRPGNKYFRTYLHFAEYGNTIWLKQDVTVKTQNFEDGYSVTYYENNIHIGEVNTDGELVSIEKLENIISGYELNKKYKPAAIKKKAAKLEKLKDQVRTLERETSQFVKVH